MSTLTDFYTELGNKQRDARVRRFFHDQHGRRWFAWADKQNQRPIGELILDDVSGRFVTPPWQPPMAYIIWPDRDSLDFAWDYVRLADALASVTADYYDEAAKLARAINVDIPVVGGVVRPEILAICGPPPLSPEIPLACEAGEQWLTGRTGAVENPHLATILHHGRAITSTLAMDQIRARVAEMIAKQVPLDGPAIEESTETNYYEFMAAQVRSGVSSTEAQRRWKARRADAETAQQFAEVA